MYGISDRFVWRCNYGLIAMEFIFVWTTHGIRFAVAWAPVMFGLAIVVNMILIIVYCLLRRFLDQSDRHFDDDHPIG